MLFTETFFADDCISYQYHINLLFFRGRPYFFKYVDILSFIYLIISLTNCLTVTERMVFFVINDEMAQANQTCFLSRLSLASLS